MRAAYPRRSAMTESDAPPLSGERVPITAMQPISKRIKRSTSPLPPSVPSFLGLGLG
jgi:hypothetical protein